jgi:diaminopimelate epimerase
MHGLGNDFVIVDGREEACEPSPDFIRWVCDRHVGVGGDQLLIIEHPSVSGPVARMRIYNVDGTEAQTCLNATRCVSWILLQESNADRITLETLGGLIAATPAGPHEISLRLAAPRWDWQSIPLAGAADTSALDLTSGPLTRPTAVNVGNPHLVCFVPDRDAVDVPRWAAALQDDPMLPEGANIGVAQLVAPDRLRLVVWERPGILTQACGSGACAAVLAARRRKLTNESRVTVDMPGGSLHVEIHEDESITLTGPVAVAFSGRFPTGLKVAA